MSWSKVCGAVRFAPHLGEEMRSRIRFIIYWPALLCLALWQHSSDDLHPRVSHKLDPVGQVRLEQLQQAKRLSPLQDISLLIETTSPQDIPTLRSLGFATRFCFGSFCTGQLKLAQLERLLALRCVKAVKFINPGHPPSGQANFPKKVIIGVIDKGVYWRDGAFWNANGTRILYFWDQTDLQGPGPAMAQVSYGTELAGFQLEELRTAYDQVPSRFGHGLGVANIAAGNNSQVATDPLGGFLGLTLQAPVILVNTTGREDDILDAIAYVVRRADELGAPCVINLSFGKHFGPHDGTDLFTRALDTLLGRRTLLVLPVGNDGERNIYSRRMLSKNTVFSFMVKNAQCAGKDSNTVRFDLEGWYDKSLKLEFSLGSPTGDVTEFVGEASIRGWRSATDSVLIDTRLVSSTGTKKGVRVLVQSQCPIRGQDGWKLSVRNTKPESSGRFEIWVQETAGCEVEFVDPQQSPLAISALAASKKVISVGAYRLKVDQQIIVPETSSSSGYTGDGRRKPDVLAPGKVSFSISTLEEIPTQEGTSVAAAIVARCIAYLWQKFPEADSEFIRECLDKKALLPDNLGFQWKGPPGYEPTSLHQLEFVLKRRFPPDE